VFLFFPPSNRGLRIHLSFQSARVLLSVRVIARTIGRKPSFSLSLCALPEDRAGWKAAAQLTSFSIDGAAAAKSAWGLAAHMLRGTARWGRVLSQTVRPARRGVLTPLDRLAFPRTDTPAAPASSASLFPQHHTRRVRSSSALNK